MFLKTNFNDRRKDLGGIFWEEDPIRHRAVAKNITPAFSSRSIRAIELLVHKYIDYAVAMMEELGQALERVELAD